MEKVLLFRDLIHFFFANRFFYSVGTFYRRNEHEGRNVAD